MPPPSREGPARIRAAGPPDAAALLDLKRQLDQETSFMMFEPGERDSTRRTGPARAACTGSSSP